MSARLLFAFVLSLIGLQQYLKDNPTAFQQLDNERPIIGIFTQPSDWDQIYNSSNYSFIAASYVKFLEQSGARVVPIPYEANNQTLEIIFQSINGFLIPGGVTQLNGSKYIESIAYMLNRAIQANDEGDIFPIMGICRGHQAIHYILSDYDANYSCAVSGELGILHPIQKAKRSNLFYKDMNEEIFKDFTTQNISYFHHHHGVPPNLYEKYQKLNEIMEITGVNTDANGTAFISSAQGKKYPIYTTQYHPEKNAYEWLATANHSKGAINIANAHSQAFVDMSRKNHHKFINADDESNSLIYNNPIVHINITIYTEVYIIKMLN